MARKKGLDSGQKGEAVLAMLRKEESVSQLARRYGVSEGSLYRWAEEFISGGKAAMSGSGGNNAAAAEIAKLKRDIEERDRCIGEITIANTIMKKKLDNSL